MSIRRNKKPYFVSFEVKGRLGTTKVSTRFIY